jgi:CYTH domain-containing protein
MAQEIERKFLVKGSFKEAAFDALRITQGYLSTSPGRSVRIRVRGDQGFITIKGPSLDGGLSRFEWEKEIDAHDALELLALCEPGLIDKTRWLVKAGSHTFEVDEFHGDNEGLIVAEVELGAPDEPFEKPDWLGEEVTGDRRYYNSSLTKYPYKIWK